MILRMKTMANPASSILIVLVFTCVMPVSQSVETVHVGDEALVSTTSDSTTTSEEPTTQYSEADVINPWMGRKIGAGAIINDINHQQIDIKTDNDIPSEEDDGEYEKHPCRRNCIEGEAPMVCRYTFKVEWYQTLSKACYDCPYNKSDCTRPHCIAADGVKRPILVVNRSLPGPAIEVCQHDEVIVEVDNALLEEGTSVHWHGQHQKGTPYMDGVPFVTQCPIYPKSSFTYSYSADTPGTHFWHSHSALQRGDGMFGALIVRVPQNRDPHMELYDFDLSQHMMIVLDWTHAPGISKFVAHHHSDGNNKPDSILVNGKGRYVEFEDNSRDIHMTPIEQYHVQQGYRYRFRIINAGFLNCPIEMSIDNHTLVVISSDGSDLEPQQATSLVTYAGERFDIIVEMNQAISNYWIRFRGLMDCDEQFTSAFQTAVLHYTGSKEKPVGDPSYANSNPKGMQINALNSGYRWNGSISVPELRAIAPQWDSALKLEADFKFFIDYDFYPLDNPFHHSGKHYGFNQVSRRHRVFTPQFNHISMKLPPFPLMVELDAANQLNYCNQSSLSQDCTKTFCECTHTLRVPLGSVVELILVDKGFTYDANHPFHLHGHAFRVIGMDRLGSNVTIEEIKRLDTEGKLMRNLDHPPVKDTITVPDGGYTILRWQALNPGYWLFHCHIEYHVELGMAIVFKVGEDENFAPMPRNFPRCNNYSPSYRDAKQSESRTTAEPSVSYRNYNRSFVSEVEFDVDNNLSYLTGSCNVQLPHTFVTILTIFFIMSVI